MGSSQSLLVWLAPQPKRRLALLVCLALYLRTTGRSLSQQHALLQLHDDRLALGAHVQAALRYTFVAQLISSSEYLLCLVKPLLAARIGRLLVLKPCDARENCAYGPHERNTVDLYGVHVGDGRAAGGLKPVLVFVHGGAWSFGHKWQYGLVGEYLATQGLLVAVINYRTFPTGSVVDMVEDVENATQIVKEKEIANHVKGFIGLAGPYDISDHYVFESERVVGPFNGVHDISSMKPAMLGMSNFTKRSPTALIADAKDTGSVPFACVIPGGVAV
ncbi:hypothetical protein BBJ28_00008218 [Nothophytophthora sp. Chile5]|nr:hypothetical protein BBJ28_00008218 [Nothophytophthora sp. Chile5]